MKTKVSNVKRLVIGFGSILNIFPIYQNASQQPRNRDLQVLKQDWKSIGSDFNIAISKLKK